METEYVSHDFEPIYDERSQILMLGTMPSPKSREVGFYYGHPRNRFWKVVSDVCREPLPETKEEKITFALRNRIAVWDVLAGCEIRGAEDSSIRNPVPNDMSRILKAPVWRRSACHPQARQIAGCPTKNCMKHIR